MTGVRSKEAILIFSICYGIKLIGNLLWAKRSGPYYFPIFVDIQLTHSR